MFTNEQMQQEFNLFGDIWKMFKELLPIGNKDDVEYWDGANQKVVEIMHRYPGEFGQGLALAVLDELGRRCKADEDKDSGCNAVR